MTRKSVTRRAIERTSIWLKKWYVRVFGVRPLCAHEACPNKAAFKVRKGGQLVGTEEYLCATHSSEEKHSPALLEDVTWRDYDT